MLTDVTSADVKPAVEVSLSVTVFVMYTVESGTLLEVVETIELVDVVLIDEEEVVLMDEEVVLVEDTTVDDATELTLLLAQAAGAEPMPTVKG